MYIALRGFLNIFFYSLYDAGHTVVGVEVAEKALQDFFTENNMEYTVEKVNKSNAHVYKVSKVKKNNKSSNWLQQETTPAFLAWEKKIKRLLTIAAVNSLITVILFQSSDERIRLYCMNLYDFTR